MNVSKIIVVAGMAGSGKTTWIHQQLSLMSSVSSENVLYFSPGVGNVPIDQKRLASEFPSLKVFSDVQEAEFFKLLESAEVALIEQGFYLESHSIEQVLYGLDYQKVAVLPPQIEDSEYHTWANQVVTGANIDTDVAHKQLWRVLMTGQVADENSIYEFWYEISQGAYGKVTRAKGIFDVADGRSLYGDFALGIPTTPFIELDLPRHLEGRPNRFSGLEVVGEFDETALKQTLSDCCLPDAMISQYQQQVKQYLMEGVEA
jgi:Viral (Superfamily 1) RNA helicase